MNSYVASEDHCNTCNKDGYFFCQEVIKLQQGPERFYPIAVCPYCEAGQKAKRAIKIMGNHGRDIGINPAKSNKIHEVVFLNRKQLDTLEKINDTSTE